jgi:hypothetical protein
MPTASDPEYFLGAQQLLEISAETPLNQALGNLSHLPGSGLILTEYGRPKSFVKVNDLVNDVVNNPTSSISLFDTPIGNVVMHLGQQTNSVVPIDPKILQPNDSVPTAGGPRVYQVASAGGGWYFNDPELKVMAMRRTVYVCKNNHRNADPDHGTCYYCPYPITAQFEDI